MSVAALSRSLRVCACAFLLQACASSSHVMVGQPRAPISPDQVRVYLEPPPHYEQIAALDASSGGFFGSDQSKMDTAMAKLKAEAAKVGANGVLLQAVENQQSGSIGVGVGGGSTAEFRERRERRRQRRPVQQEGQGAGHLRPARHPVAPRTAAAAGGPD